MNTIWRRAAIPIGMSGVLLETGGVSRDCGINHRLRDWDAFGIFAVRACTPLPFRVALPVDSIQREP